MKKYFYLLSLFVSLAATAQNAYFVTKNGEKVIVDDNSVRVISISNKIAYKLPGKTWEKYVRFKDLDYLIHGEFYFKDGYYILAEDDNIKLTCLVAVYSDPKTYRKFFNYHIVDKKTNKDILKGRFTDLINKGHFRDTAAAYAEIKKYFNNCPALLARVDETEDAMTFFDYPKFIKCN